MFHVFRPKHNYFVSSELVSVPDLSDRRIRSLSAQAKRAGYDGIYFMDCSTEDEPDLFYVQYLQGAGTINEARELCVSIVYDLHGNVV